MDALSHYYDDLPSRIRDVVASHQAERAQIFATQHGFDRALVLEDFWRCGDIDTVFILGDSIGHFQQLRSALRIVGIRRIYVEKPICMTQHEESQIADIAANLPPEITVQVGFQFLQMGVVRRALRLLKEGLFGSPVHFHIRYLHGAYLEKTYRDVRQSRLQSAPVGGAISDLGSHAFSLAIAFLGTDIEVTAARQAGGFSDVPENSDLCTTVLVHATRSNSIGTLVASRISAGAGDFLEMEFRGTEGAFRFSTERPDFLEITTRPRQDWSTMHCGAEFPLPRFPASNVATGWLRSLVHADYLFFGGPDPNALIPNLPHALAVQALVRETINHLSCVRGA